MPLSDIEVIQRIRAGAEGQFAQLVDRYKDRALSLAVRLLRNREDAEEVVQDAFVRAFKSLGKFEGTARFSTWFYRIVYNACLTKLGRRKADFQLVSYEDGKEYESPDGAESNIQAALESKDLFVHIRKVIDAMPGRYSSILSLFYFQELSYEEICGVTGLPIGTVKAHLFRARALLQKGLMEELQSEYSYHIEDL